MRPPSRNRVASVFAVAAMSGILTSGPLPAQDDVSGPPLLAPASYRGDLPCERCARDGAQLDLWPDGVFHLDRAETASSDSEVDEVGRWRRDPGTENILLYGGHEAPLQFQVMNSRTLRLLDVQGRPGTDANTFDLRTDGTLEPASLRLRLHGMFGHVAAVPRFEECLSGRSYPVSTAADYPALSREYQSLAAAKLSEPTTVASVLATFDGTIGTSATGIANSGTAEVGVERFGGFWPSQSCERAMSHASLSSQYWRIGRLHSAPLAPDASTGDTYVILRGNEGGYVANAGCGRSTGRYTVSGRDVSFEPPPVLPVCEKDRHPAQKRLFDALAAARTWAIGGQVLELFDANGVAVVAAEAVYFR